MEGWTEWIWAEDHWEIRPIIFEETEDVPFPEVAQ